MEAHGRPRDGVGPVCGGRGDRYRAVQLVLPREPLPSARDGGQCPRHPERCARHADVLHQRHPGAGRAPARPVPDGPGRDAALTGPGCRPLFIAELERVDSPADGIGRGDPAGRCCNLLPALTMLRLRRLSFVVLVFAASASPAWAQSAAPAASARAADPFASLDAYIEKARRDWQVPGLAIAIVRNDSVIFARGYGVREYGRDAPVDEHTLFAIASTTKAFTVA